MLGSRSSAPVVDYQTFIEDNSIQTRRLRFQEKLFQEWWQLWYRDVFSSLLPLAKWKEAHPNLQKDDIVLVYHAKKVGPADYRYGRVVSTRADDRGLVRSARVAMRPRDVREAVLPYCPKKLVEVEYPVQKLVLIHPGSRIDDVVTEKIDIYAPVN